VTARQLSGLWPESPPRADHTIDLDRSGVGELITTAEEYSRGDDHGWGPLVLSLSYREIQFVNAGQSGEEREFAIISSNI
jgi:hypothetical protein